MSLMSSQFGPDDMEALFWGPSILTADPLRSLLDPDEMMASPSEEPSSPLSSLSSPSSQFSSLSPPSSPTPPLPYKVDGDVPTLPWVAANPLNQANMNSGDVKDDSFVGMDWMAETMDLSDFDLDSFISSCNPENTPGSPDELVSSLDCFEPLADPVLDAPAPTLEASTHMALVPEVQTELEIKTEPPSPVPSPSVLPPASPASTLELGSEVDVAEVDMPIPKETPQVTRIVLSLSPTRIVLLLAPPKQEVGISQAPSCAVELPNSGSGTSLTPKAFQANSSRTQPYPTTSRATRSKLIPEVAVVPAASGGSKARSRVQEKKQRKMEQNKTAATRYRLKKRAEHECLHTEYAKLEERNRELVEKVDSITKEIQYLKELMEEVRVAKQRKGLADGNGRKF